MVLGLALSGCATPGRPMGEVAPEINATLATGPLRLAAGDALQVTYPGKPEWNLTVPVRADGGASFPSIPELAVEGLTIEQLTERLETAYTGVLAEPDVSVGVLTYGNRNIYVMGDVTDPGEFPLAGRLSLLEAIGRAGGPLKPTALMEAVVLVRWMPEEKRQRTWTIDASEERWQGAEQILLQPYDVVFVPNTPIDDVDIWVDQYIRLLIPFPYLIPPIY